MKLSIEKKYQIEYIKNPNEVKIFSAGEDYVFIKDGDSGAYIRKEGLLIALTESMRLEENKHIAPDQLYMMSKDAIMTDELRIDEEDNIFRRLISGIGNVWVDKKEIEKFGKLAKYRITENRCFVCVTIDGNVKGCIKAYSEI